MVNSCTVPLCTNRYKPNATVSRDIINFNRKFK